MTRSRRGLAGLVVLVAAIAGTLASRGCLLRDWRALGLAPRLDLGADSSPTEGSALAPRLFVTSAATGVFRALAIDFLWIRAIRLQQQGKFFESAALARLIAALQPRIPAVWEFHASNLAYNIPAALPPGDRAPWVFDAVRLLRDEALVFNAESPAIHLNLSLIFQHKIGGDWDEAGYRYRSELARAFELEPGSERIREALLRWGIGPAERRRIEEKWGVRLDFRVAESHALYWADRGLGLAGIAREPFARRGLELIERGAVLQLYSGGRPVTAPRVPRYAFVPDLRFEGPARRVVEGDLERYRSRPEALVLAEDFFLRFQGQRIYYLFLFGQRGAARELHGRVGRDIAPAIDNLEDFLLAHLSFVTGDGDGEEAGPRETGPAEEPAPAPAAGEGEGEGEGESDRVLRRLAKLLEAFLYLELAGETDLAGGFLALARLAHSGASGEAREGAAWRSFEACLGAIARRRCGSWRRDSEFWKEVPASLRRLAAEDGPSAAALGLPAVLELPFRLELLDPFHDGGEP